jgi:hypothetical protein
MRASTINLKEFIKPSLKKVLISVVLLIATGFITVYITLLDSPTLFGFPLPFYNFGGRTTIGTYYSREFNIFSLIADAIVWYTVSCFIIKNKYEKILL